ncbi:MAG: hypothetical protein MJ154_00395 [Candidatus Saccharibacteria bacterium]|nr:hypothetical protein [Candidatus Saccharibacteria bacterium]
MFEIVMVFAVLLSVVAGFILSGLIVVILMEKFGYDLSLEFMIAYIHKRNNGRYYIDEGVAREAIAINIQIRLVMTLVGYALVSVGLFALVLYLKSLIFVTCFFAINLGILLNCLFALIREVSFWPTIARCVSFDETKKKAYMKRMAIHDGDSDEEFAISLEDAADIEDMAKVGDLFAFIEPAVGDIIYDRIS